MPSSGPSGSRPGAHKRKGTTLRTRTRPSVGPGHHVRGKPDFQGSPRLLSPSLPSLVTPSSNKEPTSSTSDVGYPEWGYGSGGRGQSPPGRTRYRVTSSGRESTGQVTPVTGAATTGASVSTSARGASGGRGRPAARDFPVTDSRGSTPDILSPCQSGPTVESPPRSVGVRPSTTGKISLPKGQCRRSSESTESRKGGSLRSPRTPKIDPLVWIRGFDSHPLTHDSHSRKHHLLTSGPELRKKPSKKVTGQFQ